MSSLLWKDIYLCVCVQTQIYRSAQKLKRKIWQTHLNMYSVFLYYDMYSEMLRSELLGMGGFRGVSGGTVIHLLILNIEVVPVS